MKGEIKQLYKEVKQGAKNVKKRLKYRSHGKIQSNIKKISYYARYPYLRLLVVVVISFFNFSVFIEDPTLYSNLEVYIPVIGHILLLMAARWPPSALWCLAKFGLFLGALILGLVVGKFLVHRLILKRCLRMKLFKESRGSFFVMTICAAITLFIGALAYNFLITAFMDDYMPYLLDGDMIVSNHTFAKIAQVLTFCGDAITLFLVLDMMLQERKHYKDWAVWLRNKWEGNVRVIAFWVTILSTIPMVTTLILLDIIKWDLLSYGSSELGRGILAGCVALADMIIVMQDWEYPRFKTSTDVKLPGLKSSFINLSCFEKYPILITGKWFNYGIIMLIMVLDFNNVYSQLWYRPEYYGQYVGPDGRIWNIDNVTVASNVTNLNYTLRIVMNQSLGEDRQLRMYFYDLTGTTKIIVLTPCILFSIFFIVGSWWSNKAITKKKKKQALKEDELRALEAENEAGYGSTGQEGPELVSLEEYEESSSSESSSIEEDEYASEMKRWEAGEPEAEIELDGVAELETDKRQYLL